LIGSLQFAVNSKFSEVRKRLGQAGQYLLFTFLKEVPSMEVIPMKFVRFSRIVFLVLVFCALTIAPSLFADGGANHQVRNTKFGVSGGNVNDISRAFCCSGTLGALVSAGRTQYILSNNHVLGRQDQATPGEDISQPGLIDTSCRPTTIVADFTVAAPLGSNVDAALAELRSGQMDSTGEIEDIGVPSSTITTATVGMSVAKSGRTTGFTTGTIGSVNTSVTVQYQTSCGSGRKFFLSYTNQVVIDSSTFSAGGDSGSLIVTNDTSHSPVALLFAGSSTTTIANPIGEVLTKLGTALGTTVSFGRGHGHHLTSASANQGEGPSPDKVELATVAMRRREADLMSRSGVIGVGVGATETDTSDASIMVYIDVNSPVLPNLPRRIDGIRVRRVFTDPFVAY
jgi:hypothetical protein